MKKRIRLQGQLLITGVILAVVLSRFLVQPWHSEIWEKVFDFLGLGCVLFGFVFRISARGYKSEHSGGGHALVTGGPYRLTRNPMYFGTLLIGVGINFLLFNAVVLIAFVVSFSLFYMRQVKKEEAVLSKHFGEEYQKYCQEVSRYFPKLKSWQELIRSCHIKGPWVKKEGTSLALVFLAIVIAEISVDTNLFGRQEVFLEPLELFFMALFFGVLFSWLFLKEWANNAGG